MSEIVAPPFGVTLLVVVGGREYEVVAGFASAADLESAVTDAMTNGGTLVLQVFRPGLSETGAVSARGVLVIDGRLTADVAVLARTELPAGKPGIDGNTA